MRPEPDNQPPIWPIPDLSPVVQEDLIDHLSQYLTPHKQDRIREVVARRTRYLTVVLENVYQPHNASAVLRSCECFGLQDAHVIEHINPFDPNPEVAHGATKWLSIHRYQEETRSCLNALKENGYRIAAATLRPGSIPVEEIDLDRPLALCFGTEEEGLSDEAHDLADLFVRIPMQGFTQSFNVSVTAALFLYNLTARLRASDHPWRLSPAEKRTLTLDWYLRSLRRGDLVARRFLGRRER